MSSGNMKLMIHTSEAPAGASVQQKAKTIQKKRRSSFQERLLRNSCIACAVLLGVLALNNIDRPWAQKTAGSVEKALTMKIDLDQSIGQMSFVQKIMPESALVFFNISGETDILKPAEGTLTHAYSDLQPYLMFECTDKTPVYMPMDGTVAAASSLSDGTWGILVDHGGGIESVVAGMREISIASGDKLGQGEQIGISGDKIYFELREAGNAVDPTQRMGL